MSLVKISGNASGTGTLTIAAPNTNTNYTLTLPTETGTIITTAGGAAISGTTGSFSGNLSFNSGYGSAAVAYGCRAWVNFNGTSTVVIRGSGNVTSITDNGTGDYTVNFTTAMPDANYNYSTGAQQNAAGTNTTYTTKKFGGTVTTSAFQIVSISGDRSGFQDNDYISVSFFR